MDTRQCCSVTLHNRMDLLSCPNQVWSHWCPKRSQLKFKLNPPGRQQEFLLCFLLQSSRWTLSVQLDFQNLFPLDWCPTWTLHLVVPSLHWASHPLSPHSMLVALTGLASCPWLNQDIPRFCFPNVPAVGLWSHSLSLSGRIQPSTSQKHWSTASPLEREPESSVQTFHFQKTTWWEQSWDLLLPSLAHSSSCAFLLRAALVHSFIELTWRQMHRSFSCLPPAILEARLQSLTIWHSKISLTIKKQTMQGQPWAVPARISVCSAFSQEVVGDTCEWGWMQRVNFAEAKSTAFWVIKPFVFQPWGKRSLPQKVTDGLSLSVPSLFLPILLHLPVWHLHSTSTSFWWEGSRDWGRKKKDVPDSFETVSVSCLPHLQISPQQCFYFVHRLRVFFFSTQTYKKS